MRQLAGQLDLNSLHDLSRSCRQFRANLLEYRDQLVRHTLHCVNENGDGVVRSAVKSPFQLMSGKVGRCARDMVGECQRCAAVVCRVYMAVSLGCGSSCSPYQPEMHNEDPAYTDLARNPTTDVPYLH